MQRFFLLVCLCCDTNKILKFRIAKQYKKIKDRNRFSFSNDNLPTADDLAKRLGKGVIYILSRNQSKICASFYICASFNI